MISSSIPKSVDQLRTEDLDDGQTTSTYASTLNVNRPPLATFAKSILLPITIALILFARALTRPAWRP